MKTTNKMLQTLKSAYLRAKTQKTKTATFNKAYLNLPQSDFNLFIKWQTAL